MTDQPRTWTAESILEFLRENRDKLREFGVTKIGLFGSYVRGDQRPDSDMDFLVNLERLTLNDYMDVLYFLEGSFGCKVDLVIESDLKERLRPTVMREVIYVEDF